MAGEEKVRVLVFGLGAYVTLTNTIDRCSADTENLSIGGFYAFILGRNENVELSVVARSNYDAVKKDVRLSCSGNGRCELQLIDE